MEPQTDTPVEVANPRAVGRRRVLSGVALVLACLTILLATVAVWVHQVAFNTDRFTGLVANVIDEPGVIAPLSTAVSEQVVVALDVQTRIAGRLPDVAKSLAPAITLAIQDGIASRLQVGLARPQVQALLLKTVSIAHTQVMNLLRGNPDAVSVVDGYVTIEVLPLVQAALIRAAVGRTAPRRGPDPRPDDVGGSRASSSSGCPRRSGSRCRPTSARSA